MHSYKIEFKIHLRESRAHLFIKNIFEEKEGCKEERRERIVNSMKCSFKCSFSLLFILLFIRSLAYFHIKKVINRQHFDISFLMKPPEQRASSPPFTSYNWSCPLPSSFSRPLSTTSSDSWNAVIPESRGQNRICSRRSHEASSSRLLNYFPLGENYSWAISILAEILASPVSLLRFPTLFIFSPPPFSVPALHLVNQCRKSCYFFILSVVKGADPFYIAIVFAKSFFVLKKRNLSLFALVSSAKISSIQYLNVPIPLVLSIRVAYINTMRFISGQQRCYRRQARPHLIRVRPLSISYHLTSFHALCLHAPHVAYLFVSIHRSSCLSHP